MTKPYEITMDASSQGFTLLQLCTFVTRAVRDENLPNNSQVHILSDGLVVPLKGLAIVSTEERKEQDGN